ncbi:pterin-4-alpha-carbinolamine dehydratase [Microlunatus sagamiharensis]|uniref:Putative pterin-4-alpha-carbinolamine dehydratase n=1 Tax=Microlunatus sagamiharensis TaxID=546874 RepID=A0A1H2M388_9ACTN|nr:4a-hydroxytetrahydrobiopterin dehydratase [Microlunatus sagamiharensis]SDU87582.1 pterin-4-alpha-carbinolamine dehydratase [Microlunatus sagamiharensis]
MPRLLTSEDVAVQLRDLPGWAYADDRLVREVQLATFAAALDLVVAVGGEAEEMNHHPDVDLRYDRVRFALWTHVAGGVTQYDVELAHRISALLP